jgi:hypothetical protein
MLEAIIETLKIMGMLGIVLFILAAVNIATGTIVNIWQNGEKFSWEKMWKGIEKVLVFYISSMAIAVAFTMLPYINDMIIEAFNVVLINAETLKTLSSVAVLSTVIAAVVVQGKKAILGIGELASISSGVKINKAEKEEEKIEEEVE